MPPVLGNVIVIAATAAAVVLAARSVWKARRSGGCGGDCSSCGGCRGKGKK